MLTYRTLKIVLDYQPDVIHTHSSKGGFVGRLAGLIYRATGRRFRMFYSPHGFAFLRNDIGAGRRRLFLTLERIGYAFGGLVVGCSAGEAAVARERIGKRIAVVENAIDLSEVPDKIIGVESDVVTIVTAGRISPQKAPALFAAVAQHVANPAIRFQWIGGGEAGDEAMLRAIPGVFVTGWLPRQQALELLSQGDIYLQTSRWEGMPVSVIEAMAIGLTAVVTDVVGNRDVVSHAKTGFVAASQAELQHYVAELAQNDARRIQMGQSAKEVARERFGLPRLLDRWKQIYEGPDS